VRDLTPQSIIAQITFSRLRQPNLTTGLIDCLDECKCEKVSRMKHPEIRADFENALCRKVEQTYPDKTQPITYTSIGSGSLFQDFMILTKFVDNGYSKFNVNLIDSNYKTFITQFKQNPMQAYPIRTLDDVPYEVPQKTPTTKDPNILNNTFVQFLKWFRFLKDFFARNLEIFINIYSSQESYEQDCQAGFNNFSNVLVVADIDTEYDEFIFLRNAYNKALSPNGVYGFLTYEYEGNPLLIPGNCCFQLAYDRKIIPADPAKVHNQQLFSSAYIGNKLGRLPRVKVGLIDLIYFEMFRILKKLPTFFQTPQFSEVQYEYLKKNIPGYSALNPEALLQTPPDERESAEYLHLLNQFIKLLKMARIFPNNFPISYKRLQALWIAGLKYDPNLP